MKSDEAFPQNHAFQECQTCYNDTVTGTNTCTTSSCSNGCPGIPATQCKGGGNCCTCIGAVRNTLGGIQRESLFLSRSFSPCIRVPSTFSRCIFFSFVALVNSRFTHIPHAHWSFFFFFTHISKLKRNKKTITTHQGGKPPNCQRSNFPFPPPPPLPPPNPPPLPPPGA